MPGAGRARIPRWGPSLLAGLLALVLMAAAPPAAGADQRGAAGGLEAAAGYLTGSPWSAATRWTAARRVAARPLSLLTLPGAPAGGSAAGSAVPADAEQSRVAAAPAAVEGVDTGDPRLFPNRANGTVYGEFDIAGTSESYQCSGSVVDSDEGDVVLTAGHCVIDPETGALASSVVFVPGYREGVAPYGVWAVSRYATTTAWASTAGSAHPDEAGDLAFLVLADDAEGASVQDVVGALGIAFGAPREQTYTQWGYPGEAPYDGEVLYSRTGAYAGYDPSFSPAPMRIASDFTGGASGGPWTVGPSASPTVLSLTDYTYEFAPHYLYGAYLGAAARAAYEAASGQVAPEGTSGELGGSGAQGSPSATATPSAAAAPPPAGGGPAGDPASLRVVAAVRHLARGTATLLVEVGGAGELRLSGAAVRTVFHQAGAAGTYRLTVALAGGGTAARALHRRGSATVGVWIRFTTSAHVRAVSRLVRLDRRLRVPRPPRRRRVDPS